MDLREVLTQAWHITWKHKILWLFGVLAGCGGQVGNNSFNYSINSEAPQSPTGPSNIPGAPGMSPGLRQFSTMFERWFEQFSPVEIILFVAIAVMVLLFLFVFFTVLGTVGRIGLVKGTVEGERGVVSLSFGELFGQVRPFFWRVIGLGLLLGLVFVVLGGMFAVFAGIFTSITFGFGAICLLPLLCVLGPLGWLVGLAIQQAYVALIAEDLSIATALQRGWEVTRQNLGPVILMGLILNVGVLIVGGTLVVLPFTVMALPALGGVAIGSDEAVGGGLLIAGLCLMLYLPVMIVLGGLIRTYYEAAWTLTYLRLSRPREISMEMA
ncbi:MAG: hypothetical protein HUU38_13360 [Anaerolineales bacterium]|nr:hypothetical protein [Anaerolineales bacterium]